MHPCPVSVLSAAGSRWICTWPVASPRATSEDLGWIDWAKISVGRGRVQIVSNMGSRFLDLSEVDFVVAAAHYYSDV